MVIQGRETNLSDIRKIDSGMVAECFVPPDSFPAGRMEQPASQAATSDYWRIVQMGKITISS